MGKYGETVDADGIPLTFTMEIFEESRLTQPREFRALQPQFSRGTMENLFPFEIAHDLFNRMGPIDEDQIIFPIFPKKRLPKFPLFAPIED